MILDVGAVSASALELPWSLCIHNKAASFLPGCKLHPSCPTLGPRNGHVSVALPLPSFLRALGHGGSQNQLPSVSFMESYLKPPALRLGPDLGPLEGRCFSVH